MDADYLVVGSGLTGATIARLLVDAGCTVLVLDRRPHWGGNAYDEVHPSGIRTHKYGPHYFRTGSDKIWSFVNRFASFYSYEASLKSFVDGCHENWPVAGSYIRRTVGQGWTPEFHGEATNFEEAALAIMPRAIYEKFVKGYTEKQWGVPARTLSPALARRFDVRDDDDPRLTPRKKYQGLPVRGYAAFMQRLLAGIPLILNCDYLKNRETFASSRNVVFTGPIDEYFDFDLGPLRYRAQHREDEYVSGVDYVQPCAQVNNPDPSRGAHIRALEWKHMMPVKWAKQITGTLLTRETAVDPTDPSCYEYPFPDEANQSLYRAYRARADRIPRLLVCGRLGEYRYYDMDQAIGRAMQLARRLLEKAG